uniref:Uncharacterized protein n=1 Tax=Cucumis melo TaxID=3656 RepID=A0A9I9EJV4_CUCME
MGKLKMTASVLARDQAWRLKRKSKLDENGNSSLQIFYQHSSAVRLKSIPRFKVGFRNALLVELHKESYRRNALKKIYFYWISSSFLGSTET